MPRKNVENMGIIEVDCGKGENVRSDPGHEQGTKQHFGRGN